VYVKGNSRASWSIHPECKGALLETLVEGTELVMLSVDSPRESSPARKRVLCETRPGYCVRCDQPQSDALGALKLVHCFDRETHITVPVRLHEECLTVWTLSPSITRIWDLTEVVS
jgi:hypothetical protein